jgi:hypothetical protein
MLIGFPVPGKAKSRMLCDAFIAGAPRGAIGSVFAGVKEGNVTDWHRVLRKGGDWYLVDGSYYDQTRGTMFRVTKNALQHTGIGETNGERFARINVPVMPWRDESEGAGYVLLVEQSRDHWHHTCGYTSDPVRAAERDLLALGLTDLRWRYWSADKPKLQSSLAEDLLGARMLVTHTSAAAVMACMAGVRTVCDKACAAYAHYDKSGDRLQWAGVLADNQFTLDEMKDGTAWRKLNP